MSARQQAILGCILLLALAAGGCFKPHRAPVAQGNVINQKDAEHLEIGMTRSQVEYLIGRPILKEPFDQSRWSYVFFLRLGYQEPRQSHVTLHFEGDTLARIEGNLQATADQVVENQLEEGESAIEAEARENAEAPPDVPPDPTDRPQSPQPTPPQRP